MAKISEKSREDAKRFFMRFDRNHDETLQKKELIKALSAFGIDLSKDGLNFVQNLFDTDGDGEIQIDELVNHLEELIEYSVDGNGLEEAFRKFDKNGDGRISSREFKRVLKSPGPYEMDEEDASEVTIEMLQKYDSDHDKYFSYKEFVKMMRDQNEKEPRAIDKLVFEQH